jgi:hypothetical protein
LLHSPNIVVPLQTTAPSVEQVPVPELVPEKDDDPAYPDGAAVLGPETPAPYDGERVGKPELVMVTRLVGAAATEEEVGA